jgi:aspartokinase
MVDAKTRLGGIKILEGRSHLISSMQGGEGVLTDICARLAASRINLSTLTHVADNGKRDCVTAVGMESAEGFSSYFLLKLDQSRGATVRLQSDVTILSIFPHDQKPQVTGSLLFFLGKEGIRPQGLASSPSAMTVLISAMDMEKVIDGLFEAFDFSAYRSPFDWHAAYRGKEQVLKEIICSYEEQVIKIYGIACQPDLDFWHIPLPFSKLSHLGEALLSLHEEGVKLPFLVGQSGPEMSLLMGFCLAGEHREMTLQALSRYLPEIKLFHDDSVTMVSLHGPHFGDRYGIIHALVKSLHEAEVQALAISCAVSSISAVVRSGELERALQAIERVFEVPS